jgi:hypothetical protein
MMTRATLGFSLAAMVFTQDGCSGRTLDVGSHSDAGADASIDIQAVCSAPLDVKVHYDTEASFDALVFGVWIRCDGPPQINGEEIGIEFTAAHELYPLRRNSAGAIERVVTVTGPERWTLSFDANMRGSLLFIFDNDSSLEIDAPYFFSGGRKMFIAYSPVLQAYAHD